SATKVPATLTATSRPTATRALAPTATDNSSIFLTPVNIGTKPSPQPTAYGATAIPERAILLTNNGSDPDWSPDGQQIAFMSDLDSQNKLQGNYAISVINTDGSGRKQLTSARAAAPVWSPNSKQLAFLDNHDKDIGLFVIDSDGSHKTWLTNAGNIVPAAWSPNGKQIAFIGNNGEDLGAPPALAVINQDGTGKRLLGTLAVT